MIYDVITYNGEADLFDLRYNILKDYVDEFIVVEFDKTFSGKDKNCLWDVTAKYPKVRYFWKREYDKDSWIKYQELAESSPNTIGADHWKREFMQKEYIKDCLIHLKDDDIVFIGDCDEIWKWSPFASKMTMVNKLMLRVYTYYLNNRSSEQFYGTIVGHYRDIKNECLNHLRTNSYKLKDSYNGWHFTSLKDQLKRKLEDSYTKETYANDWVMDNLEENIKNNKDFLGRSFTYILDESDWPQYLKDNKDKYKHLIYDAKG